MFTAQITGHLIKDAKVNIMKEGDKLVTFAVSVYSENPKDRDTKPRKTSIINVAMFTSQKSTLDTYLKAGTNVAVNGKCYVEDFEGRSYTKIDTTPGSVELLPSGGGKKDDKQATNAAPVAEQSPQQKPNW